MIGLSKTRTAVRAFVLAAVVALAAAGCGTGTQQQSTGDWRTDADRGAILRAGARLTPAWVSKTFDPLKSIGGSDIVLDRLIYGTLTGKNAAGQPTPWLVESWSQPEPTVLDLKVRQGVTFHDGSPFTAEAVKAGLDRNRSAGSPYAASLAAISSIELPDANTVRLVTSRPASGALLLTLSGREGLIPGPASLADPDSMATNPIGAGPFQILEWRQGESMKLRAYPGYYDKDQYLVAGIDFVNVNDEVSARNAVLAGDIDVGFVDAEGVPALTANPGTAVAVNQSDAAYYVNINLTTQNPPLADVRVRQAINTAVNRDQIASAVIGAGSAPAWQLFPQGYPGHDPALEKRYAYDPARARQMLADAGYPNGFDMKLYAVSTTPSITRTTEIVAANLNDVGIRTQIVAGTSWVQDYAIDRKGDAAVGTWLPRTDPTLTFQSLFGGVGTLNVGKYSSPELNGIVDQAQGVTDSAAADTLLKQASGYVVDQALEVPIAYMPSLWGYSQKIGLRDGTLRDHGNLGQGLDFTSVYVKR